MKRHFLASFVIHCLLLSISMVYTRPGQSEKKPESQGMTSEDGNPILEKERPVEVSLIEAPEENGTSPKKVQPPPPLVTVTECEGTNWYGGIGVYHSEVGRVTYVSYGDPAQLNGLEIGDIILSPKLGDIRGPVGIPVTLKIYRDRTKEQLTLVITRAKICTGQGRAAR